jgi:hypothetical protein
MNVRFQIKSTSPKAEKEGKEILNFSGEAQNYRRKATRVSEAVGYKPDGSPKIKFKTGLDPERVKFYWWFKEEEREEVKKQLEESLPDIEMRFHGKEVIHDENKSFWKDQKEFYQIALTLDTANLFFDTKNPDHAVLYFSIIGGAFIDTIAPTKDLAIEKRIPHYIVLEKDATDEEFVDVNEKLKASANLYKLMEEGSEDALFILCWTALYNTKGFGSILKSMPKSDKATYLNMFIEGELVDKKKKTCAKIFNQYVDRWSSPQLREKLYAEAYIKAGEQYALVVTNDKKYETTWGTSLGNTIDEAVEKITQKKFAKDLDQLMTEVEKKWVA